MIVLLRLTVVLPILACIPVTRVLAQQEDVPKMFDEYSKRAQQVLFIARVKAGQDGAREVALHHLLEAIIVQDQGGPELAKVLGYDPTATKVRGRSFESTSNPFFSAEMASILLSKLDELYPQSPPVPTSQDMPLSKDARMALQLARDRKRKFGKEKVDLLDVLAAALHDRSNKAVQILIQSGISEDQVLAASQ